METTSIAVECSVITGAPALDRLHVFWIDVAPGSGYVTITCYGQAWTAYFGAMGGKTIKEFFVGCDTGYMVTKMGITPILKQSKRNDAYLGRIIDVVRDSLPINPTTNPPATE